jgi:exopolysaccharide biosynthesis polyprenyl glycosylphosphotransferase
MVSGVYAHRAIGRATPLSWARPRQLLLSLDVFVVALTVFDAHWLLPLGRVQGDNAIASHMLFMACLSIVLLGLLARAGQYSAGRRLSRFTDATAVIRDLSVAFLITLATAFVTKGFFTGYVTYSRLAIALSVALLFAFMLAVRVALWVYQGRLFESGRGLRRVLVLGTGKAAADFLHFLDRRRWLGLRCVGAVTLREDGSVAARDPGLSVPLIGGLFEVAALVKHHDADEVIIALDEGQHDAFPSVADVLAECGVRYRVVASLFEATYHSVKLAGLEGLPVVDMAGEQADADRRHVKRIVDVLASALLMVVLMPFALLIVTAIKLASRGPVFFGQLRVGENGQPFTMYKFRTMSADAEQRLEDLLQHNEAEGHVFKMQHDPRVTGIGRFLRRYSMDELPQLWNVLRGEMSVVGPRPPLPREVHEYEMHHLSRLRGKPGITGLWQVSGRSDLGFEDMVMLDRRYLDDWSLWLDFSIMTKTAFVVLGGKGAY